MALALLYCRRWTTTTRSASALSGRCRTDAGAGQGDAKNRQPGNAGKIFVFNTLTNACFILGALAIPNGPTPAAATAQRGVTCNGSRCGGCRHEDCGMHRRRRLRARCICWFLVALMRRCSAWRLRCRGGRAAALLVIANHSSYFDALLLSVTSAPDRWMMTERFFGSWWGGWCSGA